MIKRFAALLLVLPMLAVASGGSLAQEQPASTIPQWLLEDIKTMTSNGGRWTAPAQRSEQMPFDAFGMIWTASADGTSMTGRLFGISDGQESPDFWQFRQFWHPGEKRAILEQWGGNGMYGVGEIISLGDGRTMVEQQFWLPDGRTYKVGHFASVPNDSERVTEQYDVLRDTGAWKLDHSLTWKRY